MPQLCERSLCHCLPLPMYSVSRPNLSLLSNFVIYLSSFIVNFVILLVLFSIWIQIASNVTPDITSSLCESHRWDSFPITPMLGSVRSPWICEWTQALMEAVCCELHKEPMCVLLTKRADLQEISLSHFSWNFRPESHFKLLDFRPRARPNGFPMILPPIAIGDRLT